MHLITHLKNIKQKLTELKGGGDKFIVIFGYFNMLHAVTDRTSKKVRKNAGLNNAINELE